jgi:hypothetical protein
LPGQIQFVINQNQIPWRNLILNQQTLHRLAAQIHERLRLGKQNFLTRNTSLPHESSAIPTPDSNSIAFRNPVND